MLEKQALSILQEKNSFFLVPKLYKLVAEKFATSKINGRLLIQSDIAEGNDTCYSFLQDMGLIVFNRNTQRICLDPQLLAKALACFVMPPEHEKVIYGVISPSIRELSILPHRILEERLIQSKVASKENVLEVIECLQQFDFCYKLNSEEELIYKSDGYLFPFMRRVNKFQLEVPKAHFKLFTLGVLFLRNDYAIGCNFFFRLQVIAR